MREIQTADELAEKLLEAIAFIRDPFEVAKRAIYKVMVESAGFLPFKNLDEMIALYILVSAHWNQVKRKPPTDEERQFWEPLHEKTLDLFYDMCRQSPILKTDKDSEDWLQRCAHKINVITGVFYEGRASHKPYGECFEAFYEAFGGNPFLKSDSETTFTLKRDLESAEALIFSINKHIFETKQKLKSLEAQER
jgi:hypothetical protein